MEAKVLIFYIFTVFISSEVIANTSRLTSQFSRYEVAEKYSCLRQISIFFDRAVLFKYADVFLSNWAGNGHFDCETEVLSKTKDMGIIGVIQNMKYRKNDDCIDYIYFNDMIDEKKCGNVVFGMTPNWEGKLPRNLRVVSEYPGPFELTAQTFMPVELSSYRVRDTRKIQGAEFFSPGSIVETKSKLVMNGHVDATPNDFEENLELVVAFTGYRACDGPNVPEGWFNCGYGVCILEQYVDDGVVNCPFGDCRDEGSCEEAMESSPLFKGTSNNTVKIEEIDGISVSIIPVPKRKSTRTTVATREENATLPINRTLEEIKHINGEFKKHNEILQQIADLIQTGVDVFQDKNFIRSEVDVIHKRNSPAVTEHST